MSSSGRISLFECNCVFNHPKSVPFGLFAELQTLFCFKRAEVDTLLKHKDYIMNSAISRKLLLKAFLQRLRKNVCFQYYVCAFTLNRGTGKQKLSLALSGVNSETVSPKKG